MTLYWNLKLCAQTMFTKNNNKNIVLFQSLPASKNNSNKPYKGNKRYIQLCCCGFLVVLPLCASSPIVAAPSSLASCHSPIALCHLRNTLHESEWKKTKMVEEKFNSNPLKIDRLRRNGSSGIKHNKAPGRRSTLNEFIITLLLFHR